MEKKQHLTIRLTEKRKRWIQFLAERLDFQGQSCNPADVIDFALAFSVVFANQIQHLLKKEPFDE